MSFTRVTAGVGASATEIRLSIVVPTCGRPTLERTLMSIDWQLHVGDEAIVVGDGDQPGAREVFERFGGPADRPDSKCWQYGETPATRCWGNAQRDRGIELAQGTHLLFIDDDDAYQPDALDRVREAVSQSGYETAHIFRMRFGPGHPAGWTTPPTIVWTEPVMRAQNLGTPMVVLPNRPELLPSWTDGDAGDVYSDFLFLRRAVPRFGTPVWHEACIAIIRP